MRPAWRVAVSSTQWAAGAWLLSRWRVPQPHADPHTGHAGDRRRVSVVIPARNEAAALPRLLDSLAAQATPAEEVIVVDDASSDETAALARAAGVRVLRSTGPPPGWSGKCWALDQGQACAGGELLVFLDADVTLARDGLQRIVAEHERMGGTGIVSAEPYHHPIRPYEQLSAVANVVALMGTGAFIGPRVGSAAAAARTRRPRPMAFGPCVAIDRGTYDLIGGHAHPDVRSKITEDMAIARRAAAFGRPVELFAGGDVISFRMYPDGLRQLVDGWTKVLATGAGGGSPWIVAAVTWWVTGAILAAFSGGRAAVAWRRRSGTAGTRPAVIADTLTYAVWATQMGWHFRRVGRFGALTATAFPLPLAAFVGCFARSAVKISLRQELTWRGRNLTGR